MALVFNFSKKDKIAYGILTVIWAILFAAQMMMSNDVAIRQYRISPFVLRLIQLLFDVPTLAVWLAVLFAALSFYHYSQKIIGSQDGKAFRYITYSLIAQLIGMVTSNVTSRLISFALNHWTKDILALLVIVANYISLATALTGYIYLLLAGYTLLRNINRGLSINEIIWSGFLPVLLLGGVYIYLVFSNPYRTISGSPTIAPTFGLSDNWILISVVLPYIIAWLCGILSLYAIFKYQLVAPGTIYRRLLMNFTAGIAIVIILIMALQLILQFSRYWSHASLSIILMLLVGIFVLLIAGYYLVAKGAYELSKLEV